MKSTVKKKITKPRSIAAKKTLDKMFRSPVGVVKAKYDDPVKMWKLYRKQGSGWKLLGAVRGTSKTTAKQLIAKMPPGKLQIAKKPVRKSNPLKKYVFFVGPQFPDTEKGKKECIEFAQRFANKYGVEGHVYKA